MNIREAVLFWYPTKPHGGSRSLIKKGELTISGLKIELFSITGHTLGVVLIS
tara:strand:+ start:1837 stop:1992 length:156 start_codon:yes stop_codon:yes gene_type:complete